MSFEFPAKESALFADPYSVTTPFLRRRGATPRRIVSVSNHWRVNYPDGVHRREVVCRMPDGSLQRGYMPDTHPELVAFLEAAAAVAA